MADDTKWKQMRHQEFQQGPLKVDYLQQDTGASASNKKPKNGRAHPQGEKVQFEVTILQFPF